LTLKPGFSLDFKKQQEPATSLPQRTLPLSRQEAVDVQRDTDWICQVQSICRNFVSIRGIQ